LRRENTEGREKRRDGREEREEGGWRRGEVTPDPIRGRSLPSPLGLILTVSDNGVGLPEDFEIENCGSLGLKLVSVLVRQLKGTIEVNRSDQTRFSIRFEAK
jgi:two-component sensor histidine kinase